MAKLEYNGVSIDYLYTRSYAAEVIYTPDRADYLKTRHQLTVEGLVWTHDGVAAADRFREIRHALEVPRKFLLYQVNGRDVFSSNEVDDLSNGPHPEVIGIEKVIGSEALKVTFTVTTDLYGCDNNTPDYLSNRWSESLSIGHDMLGRLVRTGTVYLGVKKKKDSKELRDFITPPIPKQYNRISAEINLQSDGLALSYTFVDVQIENDPPHPAIKIDQAQFSEHTPNGSVRYAECTIGLTGRPHPYGNRKALLGTAILCAVRRMQWAGCMIPGRADAPVVMTLTEQLHKNKVLVTLRSQIPATLTLARAHEVRSVIPTLAGAGAGAVAGAKSGGIFGVPGFVIGGAVGAVIGSFFGKDPAPSPRTTTDLAGWGGAIHGSEDAGSPEFPTGDLTGILLVAAALNDPCATKSSQHRTIARPAPAAPGHPPPESGSNYVKPVVKVVDKIDPKRDEGHVLASLPPPGLYTDFRLTSRFEEETHVAHLAPTDTEAASAFVPYAAPTQQLVIEYSAERVGGPCASPPSDLGSNYVLLARSKEMPELDVAADGVTVTGRRKGWMIYGIRDPAKVVFGAATPPWVIDQLRAMQKGQSGQTAAAIEKLLAAASTAEYEEKAILPWAKGQG